jgi:hypothetical protein
MDVDYLRAKQEGKSHTRPRIIVIRNDDDRVWSSPRKVGEVRGNHRINELLFRTVKNVVKLNLTCGFDAILTLKELRQMGERTGGRQNAVQKGRR